MTLRAPMLPCPVRRLLPAVFLVVAGLLFLPAAGHAMLNVDESYQGMYKGTPQFDKILLEIPLVYEEAQHKIQNALGLPPQPKMRIVVILADRLTHNGYRLRGKRRTVIGDGGRLVHYIYLDLEFLVTGRATLLEEMTHEMTHASMAEIMGLGRYEALPMWFKEGTAVMAADQGLARMKALLARGVNLAEIGTNDEGDDGNPISLEKYVEHFLTLDYLREMYERQAFLNFIGRVMECADIDRSLAQSFKGLGASTLRQQARQRMARVLLDIAQPAVAKNKLVEGMRFFEEGEYLSARIALQEALSLGLMNLDFQRAAYLLAESYIQERNPEAAFRILSKIKPDPTVIPIDRLRFLHGYTQYAMGFTTDAYLAFKDAFETSRSAAIREGAIYYLVRILTDLRQPGQAQELYRFMTTHYPRSPYLRLCEGIVTSAPN